MKRYLVFSYNGDNNVANIVDEVTLSWLLSEQSGDLHGIVALPDDPTVSTEFWLCNPGEFLKRDAGPIKIEGKL